MLFFLKKCSDIHNALTLRMMPYLPSNMAQDPQDLHPYWSEIVTYYCWKCKKQSRLGSNLQDAYCILMRILISQSGAKYNFNSDRI